MAWILLHSFVVFYDCSTYSLKFFPTDAWNGTRGRECGRVPRQLAALTGEMAVCICPVNIVSRVSDVSSAWVLKMLV